ncbi:MULTISPECIES: nuclear transport factor 2 family protein [Pseudomonas]|uniref:Ketosteroid isomerase-related protein n=1 Tax=Pseudomonas segetis TaxID=298908 RepID=A0A239CG30_9PSED|nr:MULTISPECIES: nuclear transport factor 2 family protein [Pseudomonas]SNS18641.1 Ketosteroid isomerase-related protein [Pseudomonas segetis]
MNPANGRLIQDFYTAFQQLDAEAMANCYASDVRFSDPVFPDLRGEDAVDMWRMLTQRATDFSLSFDNIQADEQRGSAQWVATYVFSPTGNTVVNRINAHFKFADGKIVEHRDQFDLWRWAAQALGLKGRLLGWTPLVHKAIRGQAAKGLAQFQAART